MNIGAFQAAGASGCDIGAFQFYSAGGGGGSGGVANLLQSNLIG